MRRTTCSRSRVDRVRGGGCRTRVPGRLPRRRLGVTGHLAGGGIDVRADRRRHRRNDLRGGLAADRAARDGRRHRLRRLHGRCAPAGRRPGAGWWVDDSTTPERSSSRTRPRRSRCTVACGPDGAPVFSDEGLRSDGDGGRSSSSSSRPSSAPAATSSGAQGSDDPSGDDGGRGGESGDDSSGHGSGDDSDDDSSGRGSGGDDRGRDVESGDDSGGHGSDD